MDYADRMRAGAPRDVALRAHSQAGEHRVWLVQSLSYRSVGRKCREVDEALRVHRGRPAEVVRARRRQERATLLRYDPR